jgi:malonyl-CoA decarboxylase
LSTTLSTPAAMAPAQRSWIERLWSSIADRGRPYAAVPSEAVGNAERARLLADLLLGGKGEASGAALARELQTVWQRLNPHERLDFYRFVAAGFTPETEGLRRAAEAYLADPDALHAAQLAEAAEPPRQELLRRMNMSAGGTGTLVAMREELLDLLRANPDLAPLDSDLRHLFGSWFNRGFLELRRIDWQTPAAVLEKIIDYEAVHEIRGWEDLRRRLAPDRRCFGFFHPALLGEPLIFVEVALTEGLAAAVQPLLEPTDDASAREREAKADTAIFYSISNCQDGLRGVSFGNFLIKQVVEELRAERPNLVRFSTLSPIPGFRRWLDRRLKEDAKPDDSLIRPDEQAAILHAAGDSDGQDAQAALHRLLRETQWWTQPDSEHALRGPLLRACARYLTDSTPKRGSLDPVARFHLRNGARLERINWLANTAPRGFDESYGLMVNYLYDLPTIEANHEAVVRDGRVVRSAEVDALLRPTNGADGKRGRSQARNGT